MKKKRVYSLTSLVIVLGLAVLVWPAGVAAQPDEFAGGDGSAEDPYQIADWDHLDSVRDYLSDHFVLMNDLDADTNGYAELASPDANDDEGWQPIGEWDNKFTGGFDGRGHEIRDLVVSRPTQSYVGLFGLVSEGGTIDAVGVVNGQVTGLSQVGGVVGMNGDGGTVSNCYATGSVSGDSSVGGLMGFNQSGNVSNCYATSSVTGDQTLGGLVGLNQRTVSNCYAIGNVTGSLEVGGLVGRNMFGTVSNCFWDTQTSGTAVSDGGTGKTTEEMQSIDTFTDPATNGLDWPWAILAVPAGVTDPYCIWNIVDGDAYPFLTFGRVQIELETGWNMVSVPVMLDPEDSEPADVFPGAEAVYTWNPSTKSYDVPLTIDAHRGYWVAVLEDTTITLQV